MDMNWWRTSSLAQRAATMCSPPVSSEVSPKTSVVPSGCSLSKALPTVGLAPQPDVVSDSPHLVDTHSSLIGHSTRCSAVAYCTYSFAAFEARMMVSWSPWPSMPKPTTGLPVLAMPSTTFLVQPSSMPITTTAATLGLLPAPISVRKCRSRSGPNCRRPYGWGIAMVPLMAAATASAAALDRSSSGRMMTWLRTPTRPLSRR
ncbi:hypothetical protein D3C81_1098480 [compost metagenome]